MKILYVTQWFEPEPAFKGLRFAQGLSGSDNEVEVVTGFPNYPKGKVYTGYKIRLKQVEHMHGIRVTRLPLFPSHDDSSLGRAANYLSFCFSVLLFCLANARKYDAIYIYHPPMTPGLAVAATKLIHRTPFVIEIQDLWPDSVEASGMTSKWISNLLGKACNFVYRRADHIVCQSEGMRNKLINRGVPETKMTRIYNWASYIPSANETVCSDPVFPSDRINIVYGGNIGQAQDLSKLILAAEKAHQQNREICLHIFGDGMERKKIAQLAAEKAPDSVVIHGSVDRELMDRNFDMADILTLHLKNDPLYDITIPSKLQHYLACGKPIVAGASGEGANLLKQSGAAIVCEPGNIQALCDAFLRSAAATNDEREAMGKQGQLYYNQNMAFEQAIAKTAAIVSAAATKPKSVERR